MLTAAGVTCSASAASAKLNRVATASNTRSAFSGSRSKLRVGSVFLVRGSDIAFAAHAAPGDTVRHRMNTVCLLNHTRRCSMKAPTAPNFVALFVALVLTVGEVLIMQYDTQQHVLRYQAETNATQQ